jgi:RND family efflux transporter MFP subunit
VRTDPGRLGGMRFLPVCLVCLAAPALLSGCEERNRYIPPPPPKVTVASPVQQKITLYLEATGNVQAINSVDLMARVEGFLQEINYKDGSQVKKGDTLFLIEPQPYQVKLQQAKAAEQGAEAQLIQSAAEYGRQAGLGKKDYASQSNVDQARAKRDGDQSNLEQARTNTELAAINVGYTKVTAPFDGIVSVHLASVGALVGSNGPTKLATIVQFDPIWATFTISEQEVQRIRHNLAERHMRLEDVGNIPVEVGLQTEQGYPHMGKLDYISPGVDPATGTLTVYGIFANTDRSLLPGYFVRVRVPIQRDVPSTLVPDSALGSDQAGRYLLVVNGDNVVEQRHVETGPVEGELRVIESGLKPDDRVVVAGLLRAIPGEKVDPQLRAASAQ